MAQTLVRTQHLLDGTGAAARAADVLVQDGVVAQVEEFGRLPAQGRDVVETGPHALMPGFIDVHSHADNAPLLERDDVSKILQGVTTEVVGNCGFSLAPLAPDTRAVLDDYIQRIFPPIPWSWNTFEEFLEVTDRHGYVTNYAPLVGHNALRIAAMGMSDAAPDERQLRTMANLLDDAMEAGAFGLSTGLIYPPGVFSSTDEIVALARRLPEGRLYASHMRGEGRQLLLSIREALKVGTQARRRVQISHLKAAGRPAWGSMGDALKLLDTARTDGVDVRHDVYPYTAGSTMLTAVLPPWFHEGGGANVLWRLTDPTSLARLEADLACNDVGWENLLYGAGWDGIVVSSSASHRFEGLSLAQIADELQCSRFSALVQTLVTEQLQVSMINHSIHEDDLVRVMSHPSTMVGSDGLPPGVEGKPHPRAYGTFPRVLARYTREKGVLEFPDAVRRMTSLPADTFGLADRGVVTPGMAADLVCLAPDTVEDRADYESPTTPPVGIHWVMQNGRIVVEAGCYRGERAGRRLVPTA
jgi:N-acyl-D-amino-acid deacylase